MRKDAADWQCERGAAKRRPVAALVVRLLTILALLFWTIPSVEASRYAVSTDGPGDLGLALIDHASPFTVKEGGALRTTSVEAPPPSHRVLVAAAHAAVTTPGAGIVACAKPVATAARDIASGRRVRVAGRPPAPRGPPVEDLPRL